MKKFVAIVCAVLMMVSITACGGTGEGKYTIGICLSYDTQDDATEGFMQAVKDELGEKNVVFDIQKADGDSDSCAAITKDFVSDGVDLIMANDTPALLAARDATAEIPIVGTSITDYGTALGIEDFSGTVGGNISGTSDLVPLIDQAVTLVEWFPEVQNVGFLYCSNDPESKYQVDYIAELLVDADINCEMFAFADSGDLAAVTQAACDFADVIYVPDDNAVASGAKVIDEICRPAGVPIIAGDEGICVDCGVATLSVSDYDLGVAAGKMAAKILSGEADISELPIESASDISQKYNAQIVADLGITPPMGYDPIG